MARKKTKEKVGPSENENGTKAEGEEPEDGKGKKAKKKPREIPQIVFIEPKDPTKWMEIFARQREDHWRKFLVTVELNEKMYAGKPAHMDAAKAMVKARANEMGIDLTEYLKIEHIEDPEQIKRFMEISEKEGLCEFTRRPGMTGVWKPSNDIKAMVKENWNALGMGSQVVGSRSKLPEVVFVTAPLAPDEPLENANWVRVGDEPDGVDTFIARTRDAKGVPHSSIKRHEFVSKRRITFEMRIAMRVYHYFKDALMVETMVNAEEHGLGSVRSQGQGKFRVVHWEEFVPEQWRAQNAVTPA